MAITDYNIMILEKSEDDTSYVISGSVQEIARLINEEGYKVDPEGTYYMNSVGNIVVNVVATEKEDDSMLVECTLDGYYITADKTVAEVTAAAEAGKHITFHTPTLSADDVVLEQESYTSEVIVRVAGDPDPAFAVFVTVWNEFDSQPITFMFTDDGEGNLQCDTR